MPHVPLLLLTFLTSSQALPATGTFGQENEFCGGFGLKVIGARYSLEPIPGDYLIYADAHSKFIILDLSVTNKAKSALVLESAGLFTLAATDGRRFMSDVLVLHNHSGSKHTCFHLDSQECTGESDSLEFAFRLPLDAVIHDIVINRGLTGTSAANFNFPIGPSPSHNIIAPLPSNESSDPIGAIPNAEGSAPLGGSFTSGPFEMKVDSVARPTDATYRFSSPRPGTEYWVATIAIKSDVIQDVPSTVLEDDVNRCTLTDADGRDYPALGFRRAQVDASLPAAFHPNEAEVVRLFFAVTKGRRPTELRTGAGRGRLYRIRLDQQTGEAAQRMRMDASSWRSTTKPMRS